MSKASQLLRVAYRLDPEPVNGYVLARCESLDLVAQGKTGEDARAQLADEIGLLLAAARASGALEHWTAKASTAGTDGALALEIDTSHLP